MKHLYQTPKKNYSVFIKHATITVAIISLAFHSFSQNTLQTSSRASYAVNDNSSYPLSFIATLKNFKVVLNWGLATDKNTSHFIIQRSSDGNSFDDAAVIFTDVENAKENYRYADNISSIDTGMLYYRLKIVGLNGKTEYSKIEIIKVDKKMEAEIAANDLNTPNDTVIIKYGAASTTKQ